MDGYNSDYFSLRVSESLKDSFDDFCRRKGVTASMAVKLYVMRFISDGAPVRFGQAEIMCQGRSLRISLRLDASVRKEFSEACRKYGLPMSQFVRDYMKNCVVNGDFPFAVGA